MATNPPIQIGELLDVPAPGSGVKSAWCQEITHRIQHRFATPAARTAAFTAPNPVATKGEASYLSSGVGSEGPEYFNGVAWRKPWNQPWGVLGATVISVDQTGFGSALGALTGFTLVVPAVTGRNYRMSVRATLMAISALGHPELKVFVDGADNGFIWRHSSLALSNYITAQTVSLLGMATGNHTVDIRGAIAGGGGMNIVNGSVCNGMLMVEDMGPLNAGPSVTDFGDYDPDDSWDANDTVVEQLRQIGERVAWIIDHRDDIAARIQRLRDDIAYIRERVIDGDL